MIKKIYLTLIFLAITSVSCFAQLDNPCDNADGDAVCPLDTWVVVLAVAAFAVTVIHLYRKQKTLRA